MNRTFGASELASLSVSEPEPGAMAVEDFQLGEWLVSPMAGTITGLQGERHLEPKVMDVLLHLCQSDGHFASRQSLLSEVWGRVVSDEVLTRAISELRQALGDAGRPKQYIQTVPKRGYRLLRVPLPLGGSINALAKQQEPVEPRSFMHRMKYCGRWLNRSVTLLGYLTLFILCLLWWQAVTSADEPARKKLVQWLNASDEIAC